jgi:hypothetical protein
MVGGIAVRHKTRSRNNKFLLSSDTVTPVDQDWQLTRRVKPLYDQGLSNSSRPDDTSWLSLLVNRLSARLPSAPVANAVGRSAGRSGYGCCTLRRCAAARRWTRSWQAAAASAGVRFGLMKILFLMSAFVDLLTWHELAISCFAWSMLCRVIRSGWILTGITQPNRLLYTLSGWRPSSLEHRFKNSWRSAIVVLGCNPATMTLVALRFFSDSST